MKSILKIFKIFTPKQLRYCGLIVLAMLVGAMLEAVGIGAILPLVSIMGQPDFLERHQEIAQVLAAFGITDHITFIIVSAAGLIFVYLLKNAYMAWETKLQIDFSIKNQIVFTRELMANYLCKPYIFHLNHNSAILLRNVGCIGSNIFNGILIPTFSLLTEVITAATIWFMLAIVDPFTAIVVAGIMGTMMYAIIRSFRKKIDRQANIQNDYIVVYSKNLLQSLGSIKETKVMCKEPYFLNAFADGYTNFSNANRKFLFINQLPRIIIETLVVSGLLLLIIVKLLMGNEPMDIVPLLGVLSLAAFRLMPSANRIVNVYNGIKFQQPLFNELFPELIEIRNRHVNNRESYYLTQQPKLPFNNSIEVNNLRYKYPEGQDEVLQGVSFTIKKGDFAGIVGPSGAGKTTFVDILLGLLEPTGGQIKVDGVDIYDNIRSWQANLAYVPQSIYLIDGTVRENVALGEAVRDIDDARVENSLKMAELYDFVMAMPDGIDTTVGERGVKLSGGQRQRIGIARALYQQPEVLILDEATSALDNETEKSITDTILKFKGQITIIAIAHRLSTLAECDYKIDFQDGMAKKI